MGPIDFRCLNCILDDFFRGITLDYIWRAQICQIRPNGEHFSCNAKVDNGCTADFWVLDAYLFCGPIYNSGKTGQKIRDENKTKLAYLD